MLAPSRPAPAVANALAAVLASVAALGDAIDSLQSDAPSAGVGCDRAAVARIQAIELVNAALTASRAEAIVDAVGLQAEHLTTRSPRDPNKDARISDIRAFELGALLNATPNRARTMAHESRILVSELPRVLEVLRTGQIGSYQTRIAIDGWSDLRRRHEAAGTEFNEELMAARFESRILARAGYQTPAEFKRTVNATVARMSPVTGLVDYEAARDERCVTVTPAGNGMAYLTAYLGLVEASRIFQVLNHAARHDHSLTGTVAQKTADALVNIVEGTSEISAAARCAAAELQVLVSYDSMLETARAEAEGRTPDHALFGEIVGTGMLIEGNAMHDLIGNARFRRLLIDGDTGQLLDYGRETYRPPANVHDHIHGRDRACRAPGCVRAARYSDVDHVTPWESGGTTSVSNLAALCRTHHVLKTHGSWRYGIDGAGGATWQTPSGIRMSRAPGEYADFITGSPDTPPF